MDIHSHHVSQSVWQEHGIGAGSHGRLSVTLGKSQLFHPVEEDAADGEMDIGVFHTGLRILQRRIVTFFYYLVDLQLPLGEFPVHGERTGVVGAVVVDGLCAAVA